MCTLRQVLLVSLIMTKKTASWFPIIIQSKESRWKVLYYLKRRGFKYNLGYVSTLAGSNKSGHQDNEGVDASFTCPVGITVNEENGDVYVADSENHVIRKITKGKSLIPLFLFLLHLLTFLTSYNLK